MKSIVHYCQGASHKASGKPCQDCAYAESTPELAIAIVSDGHGGERYFRSHIGAELAVKVALNAVKEFLSQAAHSSYKPSPLFVGESFTTYIADAAPAESADVPEHQALMRLFASIISRWNSEITEDAKHRDITEWEIAHVEKQYLDEFVTKHQDADATYEKTYGCTLMTYVQTRDYWFAFHIGDGKFVALDSDNGNLVCAQPIPWDERCFLNKTTSMCDANAIEHFRYCYRSDGHFPLAVFLGSDGLDDTYGDGEHLYNFYIEVLKLLIRNGHDKTLKALKRDLPKISKIGSKDDMAVAAIYDDASPVDTFLMLSKYQEELLEEKMQSLEQRKKELEQRLSDFGDPKRLDRAGQIERQYAENDLRRAVSEWLKTKKRLASLRGERTKFVNRSKDDAPVALPMNTDNEAITE